MAANIRHVTGAGSGELTSLTISTGQRDQKWLESLNAQSLSPSDILQQGHTSEASYIALPTRDCVFKCPLRLWGTSPLNART